MTASTSCVEAFSALPCSNNVVGALFISLIYGLIVRSSVIAIGRGLVLPLLGATPLAVLVIVSGYQDHIHLHVAIAAICGTTAALLSAWACVVLVGRCEVEDDQATDKLLRNPWELFNTGTTLDASTTSYAWVMVASVSLYLPVTVPDLLGAHNMQPAYAIAATLCLAACAAYLTYQVLGPMLLHRSEQSRLHRFFRYNVVRSLTYYSTRYGGILQADGSLNLQAIHRIFLRFDRDKDGLISRDELAGMLIGMDFTTSSDPQLLDAFIDTWFSHFTPDVEAGQALVQSPYMTHAPSSTPLSVALIPAESGGLQPAAPHPVTGITEDMFVKVLQGWFEEKQRHFQRDFPSEEAPKQVKRSGSTLMWLLTKPAPEEGYREKLLALPRQASHELRGDDDYHAEEAELPSSGFSCDTGTTQPLSTPKWHAMAAAGQLLLGFLLCGIFSVPLSSSITDLASALGLPAFSVAFLVAPLVLLSPEIQAWLGLASRKRCHTASAVMCQLYGAGALRTGLALGLLLLMFAARGEKHEWEFTPEVLAVALTLAGLGTFAAMNRTVRTWQALLAVWAFPLLLLATLLMRWTLHTAVPPAGP